MTSVTLTATAGDIGQAASTLISGTTVTLTAGGNIGLDGNLSVGLGDATLTAADVVILRGTLEVTLAAANDYSEVDVIASSINLTQADLELTGAYVPSPGEAFTIVTGTSIIGTFVGLPDGTEVEFNGEPLEVNYSATNVTLARGYDYDFGDWPRHL